MLRLNLNSLTINNFFLFSSRLPKWKSQKSKINQFQASNDRREKTANARAERWNLNSLFKYLNYREILIVACLHYLFFRHLAFTKIIEKIFNEIHSPNDCGKRLNWIKAEAWTMSNDKTVIFVRFLSRIISGGIQESHLKFIVGFFSSHNASAFDEVYLFKAGVMTVWIHVNW